MQVYKSATVVGRNLQFPENRCSAEQRGRQHPPSDRRDCGPARSSSSRLVARTLGSHGWHRRRPTPSTPRSVSPRRPAAPRSSQARSTGPTGHQGETEARCEQAGARLAALVEVTEGGEEREGGSGCCGHVLHPLVPILLEVHLPDTSLHAVSVRESSRFGYGLPISQYSGDLQPGSVQ